MFLWWWILACAHFQRHVLWRSGSFVMLRSMVNLSVVKLFLMWTTNTLIRLRECAGWFESYFGAHVRRYVFSRRVSFIVPRLFEEKWRDTVFGFPWCVARGAWRVVRGAWFRVFSGYFVPLTPPTVSVQSFWNFTGVLRMVWRYACGFFRILK